jgi:hypothetical protein
VRCNWPRGPVRCWTPSVSSRHCLSAFTPRQLPGESPQKPRNGARTALARRNGLLGPQSHPQQQLQLRQCHRFGPRRCRTAVCARSGRSPGDSICSGLPPRARAIARFRRHRSPRPEVGRQTLSSQGARTSSLPRSTSWVRLPGCLVLGSVSTHAPCRLRRGDGRAGRRRRSCSLGRRHCDRTRDPDAQPGRGRRIAGTVAGQLASARTHDGPRQRTPTRATVTCNGPTETRLAHGDAHRPAPSQTRDPIRVWSRVQSTELPRRRRTGLGVLSSGRASAAAEGPGGSTRVLRVRAGRPRERLRASRELPASEGS